MNFKEKLMKTMLDLVAVPGISGTESENLVADKIYEILMGIPYFQRNPEKLQKIKIKSDDLGRTFVSALFSSRNKSNKTIILTGHHDVVGVESFGHLKELAFNPNEYSKKIEELRLDEEATEDLRSGEWLFGRGVADMKHGIALGIELLRELSEADDFEGNILFLSVPGEEYNSEGMLGAIDHLLELQNSGLEFVGLLLMEPSSTGINGADKMIHIGSVGKINLLFFFAGKETHVGFPFEGFNPNSLASELNRLLELNLEICEEFNSEFSTPPTCLKQIDLKDIYSVTTPLYSAAYYNLQTLNMNIGELMIKLKEICNKAFENVLETLIMKREVCEKIRKEKLRPMDIKPLVLTYNELYQAVKNTHGNDLDILLSIKIKEWKKAGHDIQTIAIYMVREVYDLYPNKVPMIIIGFAPPYYPSRYPDMEREDIKNYFAVVDRMITYAKEKYDVNIIKNNFGGIMDLSYIELDDKNGIDEVALNLLGLGDSYMFPVESLKQLAIPGIVLGAWGKGIHQYTERVNIPYSFGIVPELCRYLIYNMLGDVKNTD
jgi:arginine utilization protein RocB